MANETNFDDSIKFVNTLFIRRYSHSRGKRISKEAIIKIANTIKEIVNEATDTAQMHNRNTVLAKDVLTTDQLS